MNSYKPKNLVLKSLLEKGGANKIIDIEESARFDRGRLYSQQQESDKELV